MMKEYILTFCNIWNEDNMKLEYIRSFIGVVNYKSFSLAAKYLFLSRSEEHTSELQSH